MQAIESAIRKKMVALVSEVLFLAVVVLIAGATVCAQNPSSPTIPNDSDKKQGGTQTQQSRDIYDDPAIQAKIKEVREELVDANFASFRSRLSFKYSCKLRPEDTRLQGIKLGAAYSFGPRKRYGVAMEAPFKFVTSSGSTVAGFGDLELYTGMVLHEGERYKDGAGVQFNAPTATSSVLGGQQSTFKILYGGTITLTPKWYLSLSFNYAMPIWTKSGPGVNEVEPEIDLARALPWFTVYVHWNNYYDWPQPEKWENTIKFGGSRKLDKKRLWNLNLYCELPFDAQSREKFNSNWGFGLTRYF